MAKVRKQFFDGESFARTSPSCSATSGTTSRSSCGARRSSSPGSGARLCRNTRSPALYPAAPVRDAVHRRGPRRPGRSQDLSRRVWHPQARLRTCRSACSGPAGLEPPLICGVRCSRPDVFGVRRRGVPRRDREHARDPTGGGPVARAVAGPDDAPRGPPAGRSAGRSAVDERLRQPPEGRRPGRHPRPDRGAPSGEHRDGPHRSTTRPTSPPQCCSSCVSIPLTRLTDAPARQRANGGTAIDDRHGSIDEARASTGSTSRSAIARCSARCRWTSPSRR